MGRTPFNHGENLAHQLRLPATLLALFAGYGWRFGDALRVGHQRA
jgi:hypothetical protein